MGKERCVSATPELEACTLLLGGQAEPLTAHAAVVTLPLGVLKADAVAFEPPLPGFKLRAMAALDMGTENRVAMLFPTVWPSSSPHPLPPPPPRPFCSSGYPVWWARGTKNARPLEGQEMRRACRSALCGAAGRQ